MRSFYHGDQNFHSLIYLRLQYRTTHCFESFIVPTMERPYTGEASNHIVNNVVREHRSKARDDSRSGLHDANDKIVSGNLVQRVLSFLSPKRLSSRMTFATPLQLRVSSPLDTHCQGQHPSLNSEHEMRCSKRQRKQRRQRELCKWWSWMPVQTAKYPLRVHMRDSKSGFRVNICQRGRCLQAISIYGFCTRSH
jgi:hypothetical protein